MTHPSRGPNYLESLLKADGIQVSFVTIKKILERVGLVSRYDRWLAIEKHQAEKPFELTAELIAFIEKQNPQFKKRNVESGKPGELLNQDTFLVGSFKGVGPVYMHVIVDTCCSYAFYFMHVSKQAEAAVAVLYNDVLPFYQKHKLSVENILTDNGREFCDTEQHPYELYLELNDIKHRRTKIRHPQTTVSSSDSTGRCLTSSSGSRCVKRFFQASIRCRPTSINGFSFTMNSGLIWATETMGKNPWSEFSILNNLFSKVL
jgi:hypothetical protein